MHNKRECLSFISCVVNRTDVNGGMSSGEWKNSFENKIALPVEAEKTVVVEILSRYKNFYCCCWDFGEETDKTQKNTFFSLTERQQIEISIATNTFLSFSTMTLHTVCLDTSQNLPFSKACLVGKPSDAFRVLIPSNKSTENCKAGPFICIHSDIFSCGLRMFEETTIF